MIIVKLMTNDNSSVMKLTMTATNDGNSHTTGDSYDVFFLSITWV